MKVGFIGLGIMGKPMAKRLLKANVELYVNNRSRPAVEELMGLGAIQMSSAKEVAENTDVIILMLPDSPDVEKVIAGPLGIIEAATIEGKVIIDMSSINPVTSRKMSEKLILKGAFLLDAPVSGGETGAIEAKLAIMVGGPKEKFETVKPILEKMGTSINRVGEIGSGNSVKLMNQIMVAIHIASLSEAVAFGKKAGIDPRIAFEAIRGGLAGSKVMEMKIENLAEEIFKPGFRIELHAKDLRNAISMAKDIGADMPLSQQMLNWFEELSEEGFAHEDHSGLYRKYL
jgi:2-hydroxy-3-oxopropionate reductase